MEEAIDIGEVARRTGLTARGLRFYEARGLIRPLRTQGGRRLYGAGELAQLNAVVALKRAGFPLRDIARMLAPGRVDLGRLVAAQIEALDAHAVEIEAARTLLLSIQSRIDRGEPIDVATLCSLIEKGSRLMERTRWQAAVDRDFTAETQAGWQRRPAEPGRADPADYLARWTDFAGRVEAALPLDPASPEAQVFLDEWCALLGAFDAIATPEMREGVARVSRTLNAETPEPHWGLIQAAIEARLEAGGTVSIPEWISGEPAS